MSKRSNKVLLFIVAILFFALPKSVCFSQSIVSGTVKDNLGELGSVSIVLRDGSDNSTIAYTHSNDAGYYELETDKYGDFSLTFSSFGHESKTINLSLNESQKEYNIDVVLEEEPIKLDDIVINAEFPMTIKEDTITFKSKYYARGNEQTVEDLLKNIPGVNVDSEGAIKVGNQEIEKLMVDGDDFFEKGYKTLSKNMPAFPIEEIEVLKNYSNNHLMKGLEESNKVALNLKLNEESKNIWFGNIDIAVGNDWFYQMKGNLMNFGKTNKYYFLTNLNNTGSDATTGIENLIRPFRIDDTSNIGDNKNAESFINLSKSILNFKKSRTNFNNAKLISLNAIFNPNEKLNIKALGFFNWDDMDFFRKSINLIDTNGAKFTNTEDYHLNNKKKTGFGKIDFVYNISKNKMIETNTQYSIGDFNDKSNLIFNDNSITENLKHQNTLFDQKISYTNKFKDNSVLSLSGRFKDERTPQNYGINRFVYQDLFSDFDNANAVSQQIDNQMQFAGVNARLLNPINNGDLLEIQFGNEFRKDNLTTVFSLLKDNSILDKPNDFQNKTNYQVNDLYLKGKYRLNLNELSITAQVNTHQLFNKLNNNGNLSNESPLFVNPRLSFDWKINNRNKLMSSYSYNTTNAKILDVFNNFALKDFRSFSKGTADFNQLDASRVTLSHQFGNWKDRFFANTLILYNKNHDFLSTNSILNQNFTLSEKIHIKDRELISINSQTNYYFKSISSSLKLALSYTKGEYKNIVNNSNLRKVTFDNYSYALELRSGLRGIFNYHAGSKWTTNKMKTTSQKSFTDNMTFLDLSFVFNDKFDIEIQSERYYFGNFKTDNTYYFLDLDARYKLIKDKLTLGLSGKNLFNTGKFINFSINDIGTSTTEFRLLPRIVLLKLEYRF